MWAGLARWGGRDDLQKQVTQMKLALTHLEGQLERVHSEGTTRPMWIGNIPPLTIRLRLEGSLS